MFKYERPLRFAEIDSAGLLFFGRFPGLCHEALEALFDQLDGGYAHVTGVRDLGIPTAHFEIDYHAALVYGDVVTVEVETVRVGTKSITFRHSLRRQDGVVAATAIHVVVTWRISTRQTLPIPPDMRAIVAAHLTESPKP